MHPALCPLKHVTRVRLEHHPLTWSEPTYIDQLEEIIRQLNAVKYDGPLSVEWEDIGMDREAGAEEACEFVRSVDFKPARAAFDSAFARE